ncbi:MAG: hypothetical protein ACYC6Y_20070, partial [Thermoguttaceae bacterium]
GCVFPADPDQGTKVFLSGNLAPYSPAGSGDQWANVTWYEQAGGRWVERRPAPVALRSLNPLPAAPVAVQPAKEAYQSVLSRAGAIVRDADDLRVLEDVRKRTGRVGRKAAP